MASTSPSPAPAAPHTQASVHHTASNDMDEVEQVQDGHTAGPEAEGEGEAMDVDEDDDMAVEDILMPDPICSDDALRCAECSWEIIDNFCQSCGLEHNDYDGEDPVQPESHAITRNYYDILHVDRQAMPRGTTPLGEVEPDVADMPAMYKEREEMYHDLLSRGATREMCVRYQLRFHHEYGIVAWADDDLFEEFTGKVMEDGDLWQIHLGRRVNLESDDQDGSFFMEDLIEESCLFQVILTEEHGRWETVLTKQGRRKKRVWVTRPTIAVHDILSESEDEGEVDEGGDDDDGDQSSDSADELSVDPHAPPGTLFLDEYESDDFEDDASELDHPAFDAGVAADALLLDTYWDSDEFYENYTTSEDSQADYAGDSSSDPDE